MSAKVSQGVESEPETQGVSILATGPGSQPQSNGGAVKSTAISQSGGAPYTNRSFVPWSLHKPVVRRVGRNQNPFPAPAAPVNQCSNALPSSSALPTYAVPLHNLRDAKESPGTEPVCGQKRPPVRDTWPSYPHLAPHAMQAKPQPTQVSATRPISMASMPSTAHALLRQQPQPQERAFHGFQGAAMAQANASFPGRGNSGAAASKYPSNALFANILSGGADQKSMGVMLQQLSSMPESACQDGTALSIKLYSQQIVHQMQLQQQIDMLQKALASRSFSSAFAGRGPEIGTITGMPVPSPAKRGVPVPLNSLQGPAMSHPVCHGTGNSAQLHGLPAAGAHGIPIATPLSENSSVESATQAVFDSTIEPAQKGKVDSRCPKISKKSAQNSSFSRTRENGTHPTNPAPGWAASTGPDQGRPGFLKAVGRADLANGNIDWDYVDNIIVEGQNKDGVRLTRQTISFMAIETKTALDLDGFRQQLLHKMEDSSAECLLSFVPSNSVVLKNCLCFTCLSAEACLGQDKVKDGSAKLVFSLFGNGKITVTVGAATPRTVIALAKETCICVSKTFGTKQPSEIHLNSTPVFVASTGFYLSMHSAVKELSRDPFFHKVDFCSDTHPKPKVSTGIKLECLLDDGMHVKLLLNSHGTLTTNKPLPLPKRQAKILGMPTGEKLTGTHSMLRCFYIAREVLHRIKSLRPKIEATQDHGRLRGMSRRGRIQFRKAQECAADSALREMGAVALAMAEKKTTSVCGENSAVSEIHETGVQNAGEEAEDSSSCNSNDRLAAKVLQAEHCCNTPDSQASPSSSKLHSDAVNPSAIPHNPPTQTGS